MKRKSQKEKNFELRKVAHFKKVFLYASAQNTHTKMSRLFLLLSMAGERFKGFLINSSLSRQRSEHRCL